MSERRGLVVLIGLDSASPGTTFLRLINEAQEAEYLALITTSEDDSLGVTAKLTEKFLPLAKNQFEPGKTRIWGGNNAESLPGIEHSVTEAIDWMFRHGLHPSEIVVDATKGRRTMEFGALIAADRQNVEVQYLAADWHHMDDRPRHGTEGFRLVRRLWHGVGSDAEPSTEQ